MANDRKRRAGLLAVALGFGLLFLQAAPAGTILRASCPCGFHVDEIMAGGGMSNFDKVCGAPAYCPSCKKLEILNYLDDSAKCPSCSGKVVFYNDPSLQEKLPAGAKPATVFDWNTGKKGTFSLPDVGYLCPRCGKMTLRFSAVGFWD